MSVIASGFSIWHLFGLTDKTLAGALTPAAQESSIIMSAFFSCFVLLGLAVIARMGLERAKARNGVEKYFPDEKLSARNAAELFVVGISGMMSDVLGRKDIRTFFPLIGGMFAYIFACNIQGIFPGLLPPTDNINTNVGMAVIAFLVFNYVGLSRDAVGYIKHLMGPVLPLAVLLFPIEVIGLFVRPFSLSVRLTGNMFSDHTVFNVMSDLIPPVWPVAFLALAILVSLIQAFVFSLLTTIYIGLSVPHDDHDEH
jgi:F-type H+-transporting ATPase subunit a